MTRLDAGRRELRSFSDEVTCEAARSLELLRDIESTLIWLEKLTGQLRADAAFAEKANGMLARFTDAIDPDHAIQDKLELAQNAVLSLYDLLVEKRQAARKDGRLDEEDGIEEAYTETIAQAADLQNGINELRWNIGEHDIDASPQPLSRAYACEDIGTMFEDLNAS